jgi:hypothetical protein
VTERYFETAVLFGVAQDAAKSITAPPRDGGQQAALISVVFSVVALEAFLNEATELALDFSRRTPNSEPHVVSVFAEFMEDAERSRASLESKLILGNWILAGKRVERGIPPYQDFSLLMSLRNDLVHFKPNESVDTTATPERIKRLFDRFGSKNILADNVEPKLPQSWIVLIQTKAVAEWSCRTAANMVLDFVEKAPPESGWRSFLDILASFASVI